MTKNTTSTTPVARRRPRALIPALIAVAAATLTLAIVLAPALGANEPTRPAGGSPTAQPSSEVDPEARAAAQKLAQLARRTPDDPLALGKVDAPVVMVAYSEFQCPFGRKVARDTEPALIKKFVDQGILRNEWRDFPYLGQESTAAAHAGRAAAAQGEFWAFHDVLYAPQAPVNSGKITEAHLTGIAKDLGLDVVRFRQDLNSPEIAASVQQDFNEGQSIGVTGTPAFLINGEPIIGAQPTDTFVGAVERAAAAAR